MPAARRPVFPLIVFLSWIALTAWVATTAIRIERLNAEAGYYLPRHDEEGGKWRASLNNTPHDQLRDLVGSMGLLQYVFAPAVIGFAVVTLTRHASPLRKRVALGCLAIAVAALSLALYRSYFTSQGW